MKLCISGLLAVAVFTVVSDLQHAGAAGGTSSGPTEIVLYSFCSQSNCADVASPVRGLTMDTAGNLFGTTSYGRSNSGGTVFKLAPSSSGWMCHRPTRTSAVVAAIASPTAADSMIFVITT